MLRYAHLAGESCRGQAHVREDSPESDVVGITFTTLQRIMTQTKPDELLALYCFYAKETKRQKTQRVYCTTGYVSRGMHWKADRVRKVKKRLIEMGLVEDYRPRTNGKLGKPYIVVRFIAKPTTLPQNSECGDEGRELLTDSKGSAYRKKSKGSKETSPVGDEVHEAVWKPKQGTKLEKLKRIKPPEDFPDEWEFDNFLEDHDLEHLTTHRSNLYSRLCDNKWHQWKEDLGKWVRIYDWKRFVSALNTHIGNVF